MDGRSPQDARGGASGRRPRRGFRCPKLADAGVSSVDTVAFLKVITQEFKVTIPPEDFPQLQTLSDLVGYLDARSG
ncbi:MAG: phosphopantetheine-binding protein [Spirochaetaceae bacterium]|nr:phosphopantetheine-binding protein [Spirochaetaceae bacterium]